MKEDEVSTRFKLMDGMRERLIAIAKKESRSLSRQVRQFVIAGIKQFEAENGKLEITDEE